tara:strand:+ start:4990 stop:6972 length:1983 start_codon:yes stop_codon:yes gene_type:complete
MNEENDIENEDGIQDQGIQSLGDRLAHTYEEYKDARRETEDEWLKDFRQFVGQYEPDVLARLREAGFRSKVFVGLTRTKVMAAYSRIVDLLFQHGEIFFTVSPTPVPEIDPLKAAQFREMAMQQVAAASGMDISQNEDLMRARMQELEDDFKLAEERLAKDAAHHMTEDIKDQLVEANAEQKLKEAILESCIYGSGAVKAGTVRIDERQSYSQVQDPETGEMRFVLSQIETVAPEVESVSIFDLYPDPYCTDLENCDGLFRRHVLTRRQFRELADRPMFDSGMIKYILKVQKHGNHQEEDHERDRRRMAGINELAGESGRYEVFEYWGDINGYDLEEHGIEMPEDTDKSEDYSACVWFCDGKVIKIMLNPVMGYKIPYHIFPYEKAPHQFWGTGVPRMMRDSQTTMNAATRIWLDNMALSSAPMVEVNTDLLAAGEDPTDIHPWKVFLREGGDGSMPAVRWYQPVANANGLNQIIELFRRFADETTSLPSYTHGEMGRNLNKTATGMSMLMGAANQSLKSTIKNIDDFLIEPMMRALFHFNMEFSSNQKAKGDLRIVARGSTALIQKEIQSQRLLQFLSLLTAPEDQQLVDRQQLLREVAKAMEIDPDGIIKTQEQIEIEQQQQAALQAQMLAAASASNPENQDGSGMEPVNGVGAIPIR